MYDTAVGCIGRSWQSSLWELSSTLDVSALLGLLAKNLLPFTCMYKILNICVEL